MTASSGPATALRTWRIPVPHRDSRGKPLTFGYTSKGRLTLTITANSHHHWRQRHKIQKTLRTMTTQLLEAYRVPPVGHVRAWIELHHPEQGRKYLMDAANLSEMSKPIVDALQLPKQGHWSEKQGKVVGAAAGAGVVPNDGEDYVTKLEDRIVRGSAEHAEPMIVFVVEQVA